MGFLSRLFSRPAQPSAPTAGEHAVIVSIPLSGDSFGTEAEREGCFAVEDRLRDAVAGAGAGEVDGHEFGEGKCTVYMYGPDADRLFSAAEPVLRTDGLRAGTTVVKRYGGAQD